MSPGGASIIPQYRIALYSPKFHVEVIAWFGLVVVVLFSVVLLVLVTVLIVVCGSLVVVVVVCNSVGFLVFSDFCVFSCVFSAYVAVLSSWSICIGVS